MTTSKDQRRDLVGRRVRLLFTSDPYTNLIPGDRGTVGLVDGVGTIHVNWDNGSSLGLIPGEDRFEILPLPEQQQLTPNE